ncbi:GntR family transcriptional regulator [Sulfitobacter sp. 1A12057]
MSLPEAVAASLRERILNGEFESGQALVQEALAAEYECSRMPIREAFRQLEAEGLIVTKVHKGAFVASIPPEQVMELFELRAMLETDMLSHSLPLLTEKHLCVSQQKLQELDQAYRQNEITRWGTLNWEFHKSLYVAANRVQSLAIVAGINVQIERYIRLQLLLNQTFNTAETEHRTLLEMCRAGDETASIPFLKDHILNAGRELVDALQAKKGR